MEKKEQKKEKKNNYFKNKNSDNFQSITMLNFLIQNSKVCRKLQMEN